MPDFSDEKFEDAQALKLVKPSKMSSTRRIYLTRHMPTFYRLDGEWLCQSIIA